MKKEIQFKIRNNVEDLEQTNFTIKGFLEACEVNEQTIFKVNLILEELVTNIIKYGFDTKNESHYVQIMVSLKSENKIYIRIVDTGREFNPLYVPNPEMDISVKEMKVGGLGLYLVKNMISDINYLRTEEKNIQQIWLNRS